jgi:MFS family permease
MIIPTPPTLSAETLTIFGKLVVLDEFQAKRPNIFGAHGGRSRVFAMTEISFNLGLMIGPLLAGFITENVDFGAMSITLGKSMDCTVFKTP